jgi:hypothetical protein
MATQTLTDQSRKSRERNRPFQSFGDPVAAGWAARESRAISGLAQTAASMAAAERKRHGREVAPEDRADAAQDALIFIYGGETPPRLADLIDPERPTIASPDGERESPRPRAEIVAAAGASLDKAHRNRELLDPDAGSGLLVQSAESRIKGDALRSVAAQLVDPTVSPIPLEVERAIGEARIWPDDPIRQAIADYLCPDLTAEDWIAAGERAKTAAAIRKRRQRGKLALEVDPKGRVFASLLLAAIEPTEAEEKVFLEGAIASMQSANPYGGKGKAASLCDPAWRTTQPRIYPLKVQGAAADTESTTTQPECPGHPCDDYAGEYPYAAIGDVAYCDGSCQG